MQPIYQASLLASLLPLLLTSAVMGVTAFLLARDKGRNVTLWTVLGLIPFVNFLCFSFFIGAANLRAERKLDELLARHDGPGRPDRV
ncbi:hypothetical protein [Xylophilus sp. ASV27]|uniref:hypothetical protein n=1 Tax=Xylophilus sp. ASV27 TaxID=2795129 RepID=UPI0018ED7ED1|nr:hypothetical protein [Xylophilus sp. ASV27]